MGNAQLYVLLKENVPTLKFKKFLSCLNFYRQLVSRSRIIPAFMEVASLPIFIRII